MACTCPLTSDDLAQLSTADRAATCARAVAGPDAKTIAVAVHAITTQAQQIAVEAQRLTPGAAARAWLDATTALYKGPDRARTVDGLPGHKSELHKGSKTNPARTYRNTAASKGGDELEPHVVYTVANALERGQLQARPEGVRHGLDGRLGEQTRASSVAQDAPGMKAGLEAKASWVKHQPGQAPAPAKLEKIAKAMTRDTGQHTREWAEARGAEAGESFFLADCNPYNNEVAISVRTDIAERPWEYVASVPLEWNPDL